MLAELDDLDKIIITHLQENARTPSRWPRRLATRSWSSLLVGAAA
jgi:DNA-binding Lrp family transcriptional regulator